MFMDLGQGVVIGGNIDATARIGMLFIDFESPNRLRVHATARLNRDPELLAATRGAVLFWRIESRTYS